ncbi:MAG: homoserine kinase, partial [Flavobacteriales bacterium]
SDAITQWSNVGSLIHALHTSDYGLMQKSLHDAIIEPYRSQLIPYYHDVKIAALKTGALGCGISGSGPSIFTLNKGIETANNVKDAMKNFYSKTGIDFDIHVSKINVEGIKVI